MSRLGTVYMNNNFEENLHKLSRLLSKFKIVNHKVAVICPPLVSPENIDRIAARSQSYHLHLPLGQLYICASVDNLGNWDSVPFNMNFEMLRRAVDGLDYDLESLIGEIPLDYDAYLIGCMFSSSSDVYNYILRQFKQRGKLIVLGGVYATSAYEDLLENGLADIVIKFEGEYQIANLLRYWETGCNDIVFKNCSFFHNRKIVSFEEEHEGIVSIDINSQLAKMKDDIFLYSKYGSLGHTFKAFGRGRPYATILGNRGCRGCCTFCSVRDFMGKGVRIFDENLIISTIKYLYNECDIRFIDWLDDDLFADRDKAISLFNRIASLNYDLVFTSSNAALARNINEALIDAIARAGFIQIGFGVETGNKLIRKNVRKTTNLKNLRYSIQLLKEKYPHIFIHCNYMIGFPGENIGQILDTFNYASGLAVDWNQIAIVQALPNTSIWDEFEKLGDPRVFKPQKYSPASEVKRKGVSIDDIGLSIVDVFSLPHNKIPTLEELNGMWYPLNTRLNFLENKNWDTGG